MNSNKEQDLLKRNAELEKELAAKDHELTIEASLERVRRTAMAMKEPADMLQVCRKISDQLLQLGFKEIRNVQTVIIYPQRHEYLNYQYFTPYDKDSIETIDYRLHPDVLEFTNQMLSSPDAYYVKTFEGEELRVWREYRKQTNQLHDPKLDEATSSHYYFYSIGSGALGVTTYAPLSEKEISLFKRFRNVFELAYRRFVDIEKAEAQAREAKIEAALERVRSSAMAMQNSEELNALIGTVFTELIKLDLVLIRCVIFIYEGNENGVRWWMANSEAPSMPMNCFVKYVDLPVFNSYLKGWQERSLKWQYVLEGQEKFMSDEFAFKETELSQLPDFVIAGMRAPDRVYLSASFNSFGCLTLASLEPLSDEHIDILIRFAKVFDLTYTRFNDLKQAEAQAREAQIELGLERVRARAMAMQNSDELKELIGTVSTELSRLDITLDRCFIMIYDIKTSGTTWWMANPETSSDPIGLYIQYHEQAPYLAFLKAWQNRIVKWQYILEGPVKKTWDKFLFVETELSKLPGFVIDNMRANDKVYLSASFNNFGCLTLATLEPLSDEQFDIMLRFAKVFDLTYTRFNDLKQAEAQTREALIEAALERVRARALAMQQPEELKDVAQVLRNEMGALGVEELETCSIYIHGESSEKVECWYALQDPKHTEKKMVSDHFVLNLDDTWVGREMKKFYGAEEKQTSIVMQGMNRKEWIKYCYEHSPVFSGFYGETIPDRTYHLYKFSHGYIGAAAPGDISGESWKLLGRAASVFSLAYSRFKDLTQARTDLIKLKEEKKRAEDALTELQATQKQLIQTEKMASLGELTAGIAHEIQNPLNFVNNFSDVSNELLEEMKSELATGNTQSAIEIAKDVKENLEKILHHGKRADAIVKGMLQHSRSSSGQKEPTDINTLAEEYLRLAYHGLRAKDKFFNAKFETDLDPSINKINVVPQEIGRVILNLINNSFYAVSERKKNTGNGYEPIVTVSTKAIKSPPGGGGLGVVEIRVKDNGNGIPQKVLDKIFQPFFTTKPTGQGTGLGLSLSYDIITKGHDGEIKVKTKEGEGSEFTITLPMN